MTHITIRACKNEDLTAVIGLMHELTEVASTCSDFSKDDIIDIYDEIEMKPDIYLNLVAEANGIIAGFVSVIFYKTLYHKGGTALINELIVSHNYREKGIGKLLIEKVKTEAIKRGMDELEVGTEICNQSAQLFYKKCGFDQEFILLGMEF